MPPVTAYPVTLGPLRFPALISPSDTLGDGLEAVGAVLVAAERKPRPLELTVHLYGDAAELDPKAVGDRLRRQITGLLENARARLEGLWLTFEADPMLDSLVLIGGGKVAIDDPSLVLGDYQLELTDVYRVAKAQTHREARRIDLSDLRQATTARDFKRKRYGTSWATFTKAAPVIALPPSVTDVALGPNALPAGGSRPTLHGPDIPLFRADDVVNGAVVSFERTAASRGPGDVIAWDRRGVKPSGAPSAAGLGGSAPAGVAIPAYSAAGDRDPGAVYGWEELYGPAQPTYDPLDPPVLENGIVRVRYVALQQAGFGGLLIEPYTGGAAGYTPAFLVSPGADNGGLGSVLNAALVEWTPDRAVMRLTVQGRAVAGTPARGEVYVTLERGWTGPKVELYLSAGPLGSTPHAGVLSAIVVAGTVGNGFRSFLAAHAANGAGPTFQAVATSDPQYSTRPNDVGALADGDPWAYLMPTVPALPASPFALAFTPLEPVSKLQASASVFSFVGTAGGAYDALIATGPVPVGVNTYIGARFGIAPRGAILEAEAYRNTASGTTAVAADAALASGGQAVTDSQVAATANTVTLTAAQATALGLPAGIYRLFVRVRAANAASTVTAVGPDGTTRAWNAAGAGADPTYYGWLDVGDIRLGTDTIAAKVYRSAGTGLVYADRLALVPVEIFAPGTAPAQTGQRNGARELAAEAIRPSRPTPTIVSR